MSTASPPSRLNKILARGRSARPVDWEGEMLDRGHADSVIAGKRFLRTKWFRMSVSTDILDHFVRRKRLPAITESAYKVVQNVSEY